MRFFGLLLRGAIFDTSWAFGAFSYMFVSCNTRRCIHNLFLTTLAIRDWYAAGYMTWAGIAWTSRAEHLAAVPALGYEALAPNTGCCGGCCWCAELRVL